MTQHIGQLTQGSIIVIDADHLGHPVQIFTCADSLDAYDVVNGLLAGGRTLPQIQLFAVDERGVAARMSTEAFIASCNARLSDRYLLTEQGRKAMGQVVPA